MTALELAQIYAELVAQRALLADVLAIPDGAAFDADQKSKVQALQAYVNRVLKTGTT